MNDLVFASCSCYALGCLAGPREAVRLVSAAVENPNADPPVLAVLALRTLLDLAPVALRVDGGATHIGKSRSRHLASAIDSGAKIWLSIDDDVTCDEQTLLTLLAAVDREEPHVCFAPYLLRGDPSVAAVRWSPVVVTRNVGPGSVRRAQDGGFGLVAMNRAAMLAIRDAVPLFRDDDGEIKPAAFLEAMVHDMSGAGGESPVGRWLGEDLAFFWRLPESVTVEAAITGLVRHGDHEIDLDQVSEVLQRMKS